MTYYYIAVVWLVFVLEMVSTLYFCKYFDDRILGVTFSKEHAEHPEVKKTVGLFKKSCCALAVLSAAISLLLLLPELRLYAESVFIIAIALNLLANAGVIALYQDRLTKLKEKNNWIYPLKEKTVVDLSVTKAKGKSAISPVWVWLAFVLSLMPLLYRAFILDFQPLYRMPLAVISPLCQLLYVFWFYRVRNQQSKVHDMNTEMNLLMAGRTERVRSIAVTASSFVFLIFWLFINTFMESSNMYMCFISIVLLVASLFLTERWKRNKLEGIEDAFGDKVSSNVYAQPRAVYKWGVFYNNPKDPHIIVPKKTAGMGWTVNTAHPAGKVSMAASLLFMIVVFAFAGYSGLKNYSYTFNDSEAVIDIPMYGMELKKDEVVSVDVIDELPQSDRTNGYGGIGKSYGHFTIDGYGKCMMYVYNDINKYIVIKLNGDDPGFVILNDMTLEKTESLYSAVIEWLQE